MISDISFSPKLLLALSSPTMLVSFPHGDLINPKAVLSSMISTILAPKLLADL